MPYASIIGVWQDGPLGDSVPENTAVQVDWPRGTDGDLALLLVDSSGATVDLDLAGADRLELSVRNSADSGLLLTRSATKGGAPGTYTFALAKADTIDMGGRFIYDVWATRSGAERQVVRPSYFNVTPRLRA